MRAATDHRPYAAHAFLVGRSVAVVVLPPIRVRTTVLHSDNARHLRSQSVAGVMHTQVLRRWVTAATLVLGSNELTLVDGGHGRSVMSSAAATERDLATPAARRGSPWSWARWVAFVVVSNAVATDIVAITGERATG